jgi:uroporphyrinogen-III synthase
MDLLRSSGAEPRAVPLFSYAYPTDLGPIEQALRQWHRAEFDWTLFTSANAVRSVGSLSKVFGIDLNAEPRKSKIAAVGPLTAQVLADVGLAPDYVAKTPTGLSLAGELSSQLQGKRIFLPRSDRANPDLPAALTGMGATVTQVIAYQIETYTRDLREGIKKTISHDADVVLFYSPSAVHILTELFGRDAFAALYRNLTAAAIGPVTAAALHHQGVTNVVVAADPTPGAVFTALENHFAQLETPSKFKPPNHNSGAERE